MVFLLLRSLLHYICILSVCMLFRKLDDVYLSIFLLARGELSVNM